MFFLFSVRHFLLFSLLTLFACSQTYAAETAAQIEKRFEKPPKPLSKPKRVEVPKSDSTQAPEGAEDVKFILKDLNIDGSSVFEKDQFLNLYEKYLDQEISLKTVYELTAALTRFYTNRGYLLSRAVVPPQTIDGGIVRLQVVEGYIEKVVFEGLDGKRPDILNHYANRLTSIRPITSKAIERYLLLANDLPGLQFQTVLSPSESAIGGTILEFKAIQTNYQGNYSFDNYGSESSGPLQLMVSAQANDLFGRFDQTSITYATVPNDQDELKYLMLAHSQHLNGEGLKFDLGYTSSTTIPDIDFVRALSGPGTESNSLSGYLGLTYPFVRSREKNLSLSTNLTYRDSTTDNTNITLTDIQAAIASGATREELIGLIGARDQLTVLSLGINYDQADTLLGGGINLISLTLKQGLKLFGAQAESRLDADESFTSVNYYLSRVQMLNANWTANLRLNGQFSDDALVSSEQAGLGGEGTVRGYDPSEWTGDSLISGGLQMNYRFTEEKLNNVQLYGFYEGGKVRKKYISAGEEKTVVKHSYGFGTTISLPYETGFSLELVRPNENDSNNESPEWKLFARLQGTF